MYKGVYQLMRNVRAHAQPRLQSRLTGFGHNNSSGQDSIIRTEEMHNACSYRLQSLTSCQATVETPMYKLIWKKRRLERDADVGQGTRGKFNVKTRSRDTVHEEREKCDKWRAAV